jgi:hypothetical protein
MADLIKFPGRRQRPLTAYQLRRFAPDGSSRSTVSIHTGSDAEAREQALRLSEGLLAELWSRGRLMECLPPEDHPVAASIGQLIGSARADAEHDHRPPGQITDGGSDIMATEKKRGNRETKKPKKSVPKSNAAAPSTKGTLVSASKPSGRS